MPPRAVTLRVGQLEHTLPRVDVFFLSLARLKPRPVSPSPVMPVREGGEGVTFVHKIVVFQLDRGLRDRGVTLVSLRNRKRVLLDV